MRLISGFHSSKTQLHFNDVITSRSPRHANKNMTVLGMLSAKTADHFPAESCVSFAELLTLTKQR